MYFPYDPLPVLRALSEGRLPGPVTEGRYEIEVAAENDASLTVEGVLFGSESGSAVVPKEGGLMGD